MALKVEAVDLAHTLRFQRIDLEPALPPAAVAHRIGCHRAVAKGGYRTVPVALARVLLHGTLRMLGVFLALVLVKEAEELACHLTGGVVGRLLGDRDDFHATALQQPLVLQEFEEVAEETRARVHQDRVERGGRLRRIGDHLLEYGAPVIGGTGTRFHVLAGNREAARFAVFAQLSQLIGNRQIVFGLAGGGHPRIQRYGHG